MARLLRDKVSARAIDAVIEPVSPLNTLERGYAIVRKDSGDSVVWMTLLVANRSMFDWPTAHSRRDAIKLRFVVISLTFRA